MADQKLSELTELNATPAPTDEVYIRDESEDPANESKRITVLNLLGSFVTHAALTIAHGAVSAATASRMVVRDASARAKFAAPGAAGDVLIKGTRVTLDELPAVTDEFYLVGTGGNMEERAVFPIESVASDNLQHSNDTEREQTSTTPVKAKEIELTSVRQAMRVKFSIQKDGHKGQVYKNGIAIGVEHTGTGSWQTFSQDFDVAAVAGDLIQIYIWKPSNGVASNARNFRLYYDLVLTGYTDVSQDP